MFLGKEKLENLNDDTIKKYKNMNGFDGLVDYSLRYSIDGEFVNFYYYEVYKTCTGCLTMSEIPIDRENWSIDVKNSNNRIVTYNIVDLKFKDL